MDCILYDQVRAYQAGNNEIELELLETFAPLLKWMKGEAYRRISVCRYASPCAFLGHRIQKRYTRVVSSSCRHNAFYRFLFVWLLPPCAVGTYYFFGGDLMKKWYQAVITFLAITLLAGCEQTALEATSNESSIPSGDLPSVSSYDFSVPFSDSASPASDSRSSIHSDFTDESNQLEDKKETGQSHQIVDSLDFLTEEQQALYEEAHEIAYGLFGMPGNLTHYYGYAMAKETPSAFPSEYELYDVSYDVFYARVLQTFTSDFLSHTDFAEKFVNYKGKLATDSWRTNDMPFGTTIQVMEAYPDTYRLEKSDANRVEFTLISHYDRNGWNDTEDEMDVYTVEYPIRMVQTEEGWRMDEFHTTERG